MKLKIFIRRQQLQNIYGANVVYAGANPQSLSAVPGNVPFNDWVDVTKDVTNLDKLNITWTQNIDSGGNDTPGAFQSKKAVSNSMAFEDGAYQFIKKWLIDDVAAPLNRIEVQILDDTCGYYTSFSIKNTDIRWCEAGTDVCVFNITIKQKDPNWSCIEKTLVTDNWQGWFQQTPANGKQHPRFSYCVEMRPNGMLIVMWYIIRLCADIAYMIWFGTVGLIVVINAIIWIINIINDIIGSGTTGYLSTQSPEQFFENLYLESAGCGREHPAPLIRDYISNVCQKCGVTVTPESVPFFFAPKMDIDSSDGFKSQVDNPYYNACYFNPQLKRGIRRIRNNNLYTGSNFNTTDFYIPENAPILTLDLFLNKIKPVFNAEWTIITDSGVPTLFFQRKDFFVNKEPLYDFSETGADRGKLLTGICFEWDDVQLPAYCIGVYGQDAMDTCGNEAGTANGQGQMNGLVNFGQTDSNPNYQGILDKTSLFGASKFRLDGASTDYIFDAIQELSNGQMLNPSTIPQMRNLAKVIQKYADYALLLKDEICQLPKILIWDGVDYLNAKCIRTTVPMNTFLTPTDPIPVSNPKYPFLTTSLTLVTRSWAEAYPPETYVLGEAWTPGSAHAGYYAAEDYFGSTTYHAAARLVNYPMYFQPEYLGTLWDYFHWIDDPRYNPGMNMSWKAYIDLCCDDLDKLGLIGDGTAAKNLNSILLPFPYYPKGIIKQIGVSYDSSNVLGKYIEITGNS